MKYAQLIMGLLIGTALGGAVVAGYQTKLGSGGGAVDESRVQQIVRDTLDGEGERIMQAVQKFQEGQRNQQVANASQALNDSEVRALVYNDESVAFVGPKESERVVVEFFDYNCPACKMQFKALDQLIKEDKTVKVIFHEYPIFGPQSETNSKIGLAVTKLAPGKYLAFHEKMMTFEGRATEADALRFVKEIGLNPAKVKELSDSSDINDALGRSRTAGQRLNVQGTPTLIIGKEIVPHAASFEDIEAKLGSN